MPRHLPLSDQRVLRPLHFSVGLTIFFANFMPPSIVKDAAVAYHLPIGLNASPSQAPPP
jgi:hypothetical protein